jgi:16S rRNA (uracil1498-N3)-methyltransferase
VSASGGASPASAGAAAHAFVDDLEAPVLSADDRHHLSRVLRLRDGEVVTVADGRGGWRVTTFGASLALASDVQHEHRHEVPYGVAFALVKGDRNELVVQKLTELGVDRIVPMHTDRCVVRWDDDRSGRHVERLRRVAREAAMQCRRAWLPEVHEPVAFADVASWPGAALADGGGGPITVGHQIVLIGPEGGWSATERAAGLPVVGLATHVLRAETAAIAAAVLLSVTRTS